MKKLSIIALLTCMFMNTACESDDTLNETRIPDVTAPSVLLESVTVNKYDATFKIKLNDTGNPATREYGILISNDVQPTINNSTIMTAKIAEVEASLKGSFSPGTTYYVCAYALTANQMITSEIKKFTTDAHSLGGFLGSKTLSGFNLYAEAETSIKIAITPDAEDETIAYLTGLNSDAGVQLALKPIKMVFNLEAGTVTIPDGQIVSEANYGNYRYVDLDENANPAQSDIVGAIEDGVIYFDALGAVITAGSNNGLFHWAYFGLSIK